jgi:prepilin-type N-terminal cleavage/methylation domain-containing protein
MKESKPHRSPLKNCNGFTLVEIIAVLILISIIGAFTVPRVVALDTSATQKSFEWAISELNSREFMTWSKVKMSDINWVEDEQLFSQLDTELGTEYSWNSRTTGGGTLSFKGQPIGLERVPSTFSTSGSWRVR